jgi:hypothetical protein
VPCHGDNALIWGASLPGIQLSTLGIVHAMGPGLTRPAKLPTVLQPESFREWNKYSELWNCLFGSTGCRQTLRRKWRSGVEDANRS